jgi:hypothetical protein
MNAGHFDGSTEPELVAYGVMVDAVKACGLTGDRSVFLDPKVREAFEFLASNKRGDGAAPLYTSDPLVDVIAERNTHTWLLEDILVDDALNVVLGPEGSGKSFVVIDISMCIAHGLRYHARRWCSGRCSTSRAKGATAWCDACAAGCSTTASSRPADGICTSGARRSS